jgi:hypothetical protein
LVEASGLRSVDEYFTEPDEEKIRRMMEAEANKPNPEMEKLKQEQAKMEADNAIALKKIESEERIELARIQQESDLKRYQIDQEIGLKQRQNVANALTGGHIEPTQLGGMPG